MKKSVIPESMLNNRMRASSPEPHYRIAEVRRLFAPVSVSTLYAWIADGYFPRPVQIGPRAVAWPESALIEWQSKIQKPVH